MLISRSFDEGPVYLNGSARPNSANEAAVNADAASLGDVGCCSRESPATVAMRWATCGVTAITWARTFAGDKQTCVRATTITHRHISFGLLFGRWPVSINPRARRRAVDEVRAWELAGEGRDRAHRWTCGLCG